jgi:RHS repeat-associated protein
VNTVLKTIFNKKISNRLFTVIALIALFSYVFTPHSVLADGNPFIPTTDILNTGLSAQFGADELAQASYAIANLKDITGAYYDTTNKRIVFIGTTTGTSPNYNQDDMYEAVQAILTNNTLPSLSIDDNPSNPTSPTAIVNYSGGIQNSSFANELFNADYKLKQYAIGANPTGSQVTSTIPTYASVVARYLALQPHPVAGNESKYLIAPQQVTLKNASTSSAFVFTNVTMQVTAQAVNQNNDTLWNQAANNFATDLTSNYNQYAQETPYFTQAQQLAKIVAIVKWVQDNNIPSDALIAKNYSPKFVSTPSTVQKVATSSGYIAQGGVNYNTPNTYLPDDGTAAGMKTSAQAGSSSNQDVTWTFTNNGQTYTAVAVATGAFKSLGSYSDAISDLSIRIAGGMNLAFTRSYSSFNHGQTGIGQGWDFMPARFYSNSSDSDLGITLCNNNFYDTKIAIDTPKGHETFTYTCPNGYSPDDPSYHSKVSESNNGLNATVILTDQTKYNFAYNSNTDALQLTQIADKNNNPIIYSYASPSGNLTNIADQWGHALTLTYNSQNLISSVKDWSGRTVQYTYDSTGHLTGVKDPNGNTTSYTYDSNGRLATVKDRNGQVVETNTYQSDDRLATAKNALNLTTSYTYDNVNKVITQTDSNSRVTKTTYDAKARILTQTDPSSKKVTYTYGNETVPLTYIDRNNNKETFTYDIQGNMLTGTFPNNLKITYSYDSNNRVTKILDGRYSPTRETDNTYDTFGDLTQQSVAGIITKYTYALNGELVSTTDSLNNTITYTRDRLGNLLSSIDPYNKTTYYSTDALGRQTQVTDPNNKTTSYMYDANSNITIATTSAGTTFNVYDKENRLIKVTAPDKTVTQYTYNNAGGKTSVIDALNNTTTYGYDSYNNLTTQKNALNNTTINTFDSLNRQTKTTTPLGKASQWQYDGNNNITQQTDANNAITKYQYDAFNRVTKITYPDNSNVTYFYDNRGNMTGMSDPQGSASATFDTYDRMTKYTNEKGDVIQYAYDTNGNLTQLTYPDGSNVKYGYDKNNRMISVTDWNNATTTYTYNDNGTLATRTIPAGIKTYYTYDGTNSLTKVDHTLNATSQATYAYTRDSNGNITSEADSGQFYSGQVGTTSYAYDKLGRITNYQTASGYSRIGNGTYTYDYVGNRLTQNTSNFTRTYTYNADNQLTSQTDPTFGTFSETYNPNGDLTTKRDVNLTKNIAYNAEDKMTQYGSDTFTYDGLGNRLWSSYNNERYITDPNSSLPRVIALYNQSFGNSGYDTWFVYGADGVIAEFDGNNNDLYENYLLTDGTGNMRFTYSDIFGWGGDIFYDPYGNQTWGTGGGPDYTYYNSQLLDGDSSLYDLRARMYDPTIGRFITRDPLAGILNNPLSQNAYGYGYENPVNHSDASGMSVDPTATNNCVYVCFTKDGQVKYVGITKNFLQRAAYWKANGKNITEMPELKGFTRAQARALEQLLMEFGGGAKSVSEDTPLDNEINSISPKNPAYEPALQWAYDFVVSWLGEL